MMIHHSAIEEALRLNNFALDKEIIGKFSLLIDLVLKWNTTINITAHRDPADIIYKDIVDNLYLSKFIASCVGAISTKQLVDRREPPLRIYEFPLNIIDMGAGAGFSGLVLAIVNPSIKMAFLESDRKKINFIKEVYRKIDLHQMQCRGVLQYDPTFIHARAESYPKECKEVFNCSLTRATWPLEEYLRYTHYYVQNSGHAFYMSGQNSKNHHRESTISQGFADDKEFFYKIEPKGYKRSILTFKKIGF